MGENMKKTTIRASKGKVCRRVLDNFIFWKKINLGYTYCTGRKKLEEPLLCHTEHFEEISKTVKEVNA